MKRGMSFLSLFAISFALLFSVLFVSGHQPRMVMDTDSHITSPLIVEAPEISQAFYGELKNKPDFYLIESDKDFNLYFQILSPYNDGRRDFSVAIYKNNKLYSLLDGSHFSWIEFYESFAGDKYWQGPEIDQKAALGSYLIIVYNSENTGKYSLAVGKIESFPFNEAMKTLIILPELKHDFFDKSYFAIFQGVIGKILLIIFAIIVILVWLICLGIKRFARK